MSVKLNLIVAVCENGGIGNKNSLPWNLKKEMAYFQRMTRDVDDQNKRNAVIMGRRTWDSIPDKYRPLAGRLNIVLSSQELNINNENVALFHSIEDAVDALQTKYSGEIEAAWVVGGAKLYEEVISKKLCHRLHLTNIFKHFECDTFLKLDLESNFTQVKDGRVPEEIQEENGVQYKFSVWEFNPALN